MKVLITGASSGIGRDLAREFAKKKYDLVIVARSLDKLNELMRLLNRNQGLGCNLFAQNKDFPN